MTNSLTSLFNAPRTNNTQQTKSTSSSSAKYANTGFTTPKIVWNEEVFGVGINDMLEAYQVRVPIGTFTQTGNYKNGVQVYPVVKVFWKKQVTTIVKAAIPNIDDNAAAPSASVAMVVDLGGGVYTLIRINTAKVFKYLCKEVRFTAIPTYINSQGEDVYDWKNMLSEDTIIDGKALTFKQAIINLFSTWENSTMEILFTQEYEAKESQDMIDNRILLRNKVEDKYPAVDDNSQALNEFKDRNK